MDLKIIGRKERWEKEKEGRKKRKEEGNFNPHKAFKSVWHIKNIHQMLTIILLFCVGARD